MGPLFHQETLKNLKSIIGPTEPKVGKKLSTEQSTLKDILFKIMTSCTLDLGVMSSQLLSEISKLYDPYSPTEVLDEYLKRVESFTQTLNIIADAGLVSELPLMKKEGETLSNDNKDELIDVIGHLTKRLSFKKPKAPLLRELDRIDRPQKTLVSKIRKNF